MESESHVEVRKIAAIDSYHVWAESRVISFHHGYGSKYFSTVVKLIQQNKDALGHKITIRRSDLSGWPIALAIMVDSLQCSCLRKKEPWLKYCTGDPAYEMYRQATLGDVDFITSDYLAGMHITYITSLFASSSM